MAPSACLVAIVGGLGVLLILFGVEALLPRGAGSVAVADEFAAGLAVGVLVDVLVGPDGAVDAQAGVAAGPRDDDEIAGLRLNVSLWHGHGVTSHRGPRERT